MKMMKFLNWVNGTRPGKSSAPVQAKWGRQPAVAPLPQGVKPVTYRDLKVSAQTRPLSEKMKEEYRKGRDQIIGGFKNGK